MVGASAAMGNVVRAVSFAPMPVAFLMVLAPRARITRKLASSNLLNGLLAASYWGLSARSIAQSPETMRALASLDFSGIARYFGSPTGAATTWTHMTTNDFFIARWIYLDSMDRGRPARLPVLLQFLGGPAGLLTYLLFGRRRAKS